MCSRKLCQWIGMLGLTCVLFGLFAAAANWAGGDESRNARQQRIAIPRQQSEPAPVALTGTGRQASDKFNLEPGLCIFEIDHDGDSNLIVRLLNDQGKEVDTVFNQIGAFKGEYGLPIAEAGEYLLDVQADGDWNVNLRQPRPETAPSAPRSLKGNGYKATPFVQLDKGLTVFKLTHNGDSRFKATLLDRDGQPVQPLVNTLGKFDGSKPVSIPAPGIYFLNVAADGDWTIDIQ